MENHNAENIVNEIQSLIKALKDCGGWVKRGNGEGWFNHEILADSLALITSQDQRIKELTEEVESLKQAMEHEHASFMETFGEYGEKCERLAEENERLRAIPDQLYEKMSERVIEECEIERKLTVRKMQERLHEAATAKMLGAELLLPIAHSLVDRIAKEMLEGEKQ